MNNWKTASRITVLACVLGLSACAATDTRRSTGEVIDDSTVATRLKAALLADDVTDGTDIEIEINRGRVQLMGVADSEAEKKRATEISERIAGRGNVDNNLRVVAGKRRVGEYIDDKVLVARVNNAFIADKSTDAGAIDVEVNRGVVMLGGFVDSEAERESAGRVARRVEGVNEVVNNLKVKRR